MRSWSIPIGRLFGVEVRLHLTFFFLLMFVWFAQSAANGTALAMRGLALVGLVFGSVVLHELGHALVAIRLGVKVRGIVLLPIGGITFMDDNAPHTRQTAARDIRISAAGPLINLGIGIGAAIACVGLLHMNLLARPLITPVNLTKSFVWANLFLGLFNLLPAYPMDGGRVLRSWYAQRMDYVQATRRAVTIGQTFAALFMVAGIWAPWLMMIGFFLFIGAQIEDRTAIFQSVLETVRIEEVMLTDFSTLSSADTLEDALHKAVHSLQDEFPVIRGSDLVGVISRQRILDALRGGNGYVQGVMNRGFQIAQKSETLAAIFRRIGTKGLSLVPVVDGDRLVGIVTMQNLTHSMALLAESRKLQRMEE
ncbi:peptidase M50 [Candidatus Koribacter versatilis Ellin345]|uniref:Zinc metalloprotease n=1 Tax=Koribacter versatilis (strain Ellin345) TaxID=204669 RepID=Q1IVH9_KORVE|nr:site-2 protease family protein [Candidatus Koribacter versatilis]ABF39121.1 peptidase M50 [Candidatus Koribacter versatilis Ellin345]